MFSRYLSIFEKCNVPVTNEFGFSYKRHMSSKNDNCCVTCPPSYECKQPPPKRDIWDAVEKIKEDRRNHPIFRCPHPPTYKKWRNIFLFIMVPLMICQAVNCIYLKEKPKRPKFVPYSHLRIRNKPFPWNPSDKSFFHNPKRNALPTGYEVDVPEDEEE